MKRRVFSLPKYGFIFVLMLLSIMLLLLLNWVVADWRTFNILQFQSQLTTVAPSRPTDPPEPQNVCSFNSRTPEVTQELNSLKDAISWPQTPHLAPQFSLNDTSDPAHSTVTVLPRVGGGGWHVGDQLHAFIQISDFHGRPKKYGGDFLLARLHNSTLQAGVAGQVLDHHNGSYTAVFPLLWEGNAEVQVILVHSSEAVGELKRLNQEQPDRIFFKSFFRSGKVRLRTTCNICLNGTKKDLCSYIDSHTGEPWFCFKPRGVPCDARISHSRGGFRQNIGPAAKKLFQSGVNMKIPIPSLKSAEITVGQEEKAGNGTLPISRSAKGQTAVKLRPSGYYYQGEWRGLSGPPVHRFSSSKAISSCLSRKRLHLYGDSTIRQWFEYFKNTVPDLKEFDLKFSKQTGPFQALDYSRNTMVTYRCHGPPIRFAEVPVSQLRYIANELDGVEGGPNTVVVIGIWSHFSTFPLEVYVQRLLNIRKAVLRLLLRAPDTLVVIRTANPKALTLYETLTNSDWYSLQSDRALRAVFEGVKVQLVDAWEMVTAHHLPHSLHPQPPIIRNMINVLLSYTCPQAGRTN